MASKFVRKIQFCFILCIVFAYGNAQTFFQFTDHAEKHKFQFDLYRNIIVLPFYINGLGPYNFILDSGAGSCIITDPDLVSKLNLQRGRDIIINGSGEQQGTDAFFVHNIAIENKHMKSLPLTMAAFETDPFFLSEYLGCTIHGILGFEFFNSFVVKINYQNHILTVYDPQKFKLQKQYSEVPISIKNKRPFLNGFFINEQNEKIDLHDLLIDTGAGFPVSMETYSNSEIQVPEKNLYAELGVGLNGIVTGKIARAPQFGFNKFIFKNIVTAYPDFESTGSKQVNEQRNGSIGNFLLNRFTVIFDYANEKIYVKPNAKLNEEFPYDRTGLEVIATGEDYFQFIIKTVKPNSPAAEIGILPGDEIEEINFKKITTYKLTEIDHILSNAKANEVTLRIRRGFDVYYMIIAMRDLI